jgi:hypothetical protein
LYFWSAENAQKDSWQTIRPREYFVFPREGNEVSYACSGRPTMHKKAIVILAGSTKSTQPISRTIQNLEGTRHSRTLYTSKALDQSNIIII